MQTSSVQKDNFSFTWLLTMINIPCFGLELAYMLFWICLPCFSSFTVCILKRGESRSFLNFGTAYYGTYPAASAETVQPKRAGKYRGRAHASGAAVEMLTLKQPPHSSPPSARPPHSQPPPSAASPYPPPPPPHRPPDSSPRTTSSPAAASRQRKPGMSRRA